MRPEKIVQQRLLNQRLLASSFQRAAEAVRWLGAVQAQDYAGAKWALGLRVQPTAGAFSDAAVEAEFDAGAILRTHLLRPTWHFVTPADIRWLLALTAPRVHIANAPYYRKVGLDDALARRINDVFAGALRGGVYLTRDELRGVLAAAGISTAGELSMNYFLMRAELDGVICSGPRRGRQFTYALLAERVPPAPPMAREEALAELARRFFQSHGPATVHDLARWASLTLAEANSGLAAVNTQLQFDAEGGKTYWFVPPQASADTSKPLAHLLSIYDEYVIGYKEWNAVIDAANAAQLQAMGNNLTAVVILNGRIIGTWKRTLGKRQATVTTNLFTPPSAVEREAIAAAAARYAAFLGVPVALA
jgi:hypothetical protein